MTIKSKFNIQMDQSYSKQYVQNLQNSIISDTVMYMKNNVDMNLKEAIRQYV